MVPHPLILRWGETVDYPGRPNVITRVPKSGRGRQKGRVRGGCDYGKMVTEMQWCWLKEEEGARGQRLWVTSRSWKGKETLL